MRISESSRCMLPVPYCRRFQIEDSSSSSDSTSSSSSDSDEENALLAIQIATQTTLDLFHTNEWEHGGQHSMNPHEGVCDVLGSMRSILGLFKVLTNFSQEEFDELCIILCPTIIAHTRSIGDLRILPRHPSKLTPEQRLLGFLLYLKHDCTTALPGFLWNWTKSSVIDDQVFIATSINWVLKDKIKWPDELERQALASVIPTFPGCIGFIDGTLVKIRKPWKNREHGKWFNGCKKMYCMSNVVIVDHHGLFIYINPGYPGSFHDVTCLRALDMYGMWCQFFSHDDAH